MSKTVVFATADAGDHWRQFIYAAGDGMGATGRWVFNIFHLDREC